MPTGIEAYVDGRCQHENRRVARATLETRVREMFDAAELNKANAARKEQVGSGMRGDKVRTYREQDDTVTDHRSGIRLRLRDLKDGKFAMLYASADDGVNAR